MSFLSSLFKKKPEIAADDPVFGHITHEQGVWTFVPNPPTGVFMITVAAPESGPSQLQRDFFQKLRASLSEFEQRARDFMRSRVESGVEVYRLSVYSIEIGSEEETRQERFVLEMSDEEAIVVHRVTFSGSEPADYGYDT
jgi:hypothetical protein